MLLHQPQESNNQALIATLRPGTHLTTPRRGFVHHGIYLGDGQVIHYAGFSRGWWRGPVQEVSLDRFAGGRRIATKAAVAPKFDAPDIVARARSRLGENRYRVWTNNCEHFCEWCISGNNSSGQVEALRERARGALALLRSFQLATRFGRASHC